MNAPGHSDNRDEVARYYRKTESHIGYELLLHGTKHFGLYRSGDNPWLWASALRRMEDRLASELALPPGALVLDAGCGVGDVATRLAQVHRLRIVGIDVLPEHIQEARQRAQKRELSREVEFRLMSYESMDLPDGTFDGCFTMETLVHAASAERALSEFYRVLRPGGRIALFEYSRAPSAEIPEHVAKLFAHIDEVAAMPSYGRFEHGNLTRMLAKSGFTQVEVTDITASVLPMVRCFALLGRIPYAVGRAIHRADKAINAMSAVEYWRYRQYFHYNIYTAEKM